ncbi:MAG: hypothetical protein AAFQ43_01715 [Bacteroidota bacterium]
MPPWWDGFWMLAAALAWVPVRRLSPEANRRLGAVALAVAAVYYGLASLGWSVRGDAADPFLDAPFAVLVVLGAMAFGHMLRRPWGGVLLGALSVASIAFWLLLVVARGLTWAPDVRGDLPGGHRFTATNSGLGISTSAVRTEVFHAPQWFPLVERRVGVSEIEGKEYGPGAEGAQADLSVTDGVRTLRLTAFGELVGDVTY